MLFCSKAGGTMAGPDTYQIVLADDHAMVRHGVRTVLEEKSGLEVVGEAGDGLELLDLLKMVTPHLVILDISMPKMRGIEATRQIKMTYPDVKVLILTIHASKEYLDHAISAGAEGYLLKNDADTELFTAIETIRKGGAYVSPHLSQTLTPPDKI